MATVDISDENFREIYQKNDIVILDFWAPWCGPCHQFAPTFESISEEFPELVFGKINTEIEQKLAAYFSIRSIPTIMIIRESLELFRHSGSIDSKNLKSIIEKSVSLDMDDVRKKIEAEESAEN